MTSSERTLSIRVEVVVDSDAGHLDDIRHDLAERASRAIQDAPATLEVVHAAAVLRKRNYRA